MPKTPALVDIPQFAERCGVSQRFIRRLIAERRIRHIKVGKFVRFHEEDVEEFLARGTREPAA